MSQTTAPEATFAAGRYSKRKRTQVNYRMEELDVDEVEDESEEEAVKPKVCRLLLRYASHTDMASEAAQDCNNQASLETQNISLP